jgi:hypothetical protein
MWAMIATLFLLKSADAVASHSIDRLGVFLFDNKQGLE